MRGFYREERANAQPITLFKHDGSEATAPTNVCIYSTPDGGEVETTDVIGDDLATPGYLASAIDRGPVVKWLRYGDDYKGEEA